MSQLSYSAILTGMQSEILSWTLKNFDDPVEALKQTGNSFEEKANVEYMLRKFEKLLEFNDEVRLSYNLEGGREEMEFQLLKVKRLCLEILDRPTSLNSTKLQYNGNVKALVKFFYDLARSENNGKRKIDNTLTEIENFLVEGFGLNRVTVNKYLTNPSDMNKTKPLGNAKDF